MVSVANNLVINSSVVVSNIKQSGQLKRVRGQSTQEQMVSADGICMGYKCEIKEQPTSFNSKKYKDACIILPKSLKN